MFSDLINALVMKDAEQEMLDEMPEAERRVLVRLTERY